MPEDCCPNCEALLHGRYCSDCGQRKPRPGDYSTLGVLGDAFKAIFSVDGKTLRTLRGLLVHPGRLTLDHFQGRRAKYLKPIQIFLLVNVLFLLIAIGTGLFDFKLGEYLKEGPPSPELARRLVAQQVAENGVSFEDYAAAFDRQGELLRKSLIFLLVPLFALVPWALHHRRRRYYAEHLVFSMHFYSFFWLFTTLAGLPVAVLAERYGVQSDVVLEPFFGAVTLIYLYLMLRTVYAYGCLGTLARAVICLVAVLLLMDFYRLVLFFGTYLIT
jgi:hypothetical protein